MKKFSSAKEFFDLYAGRKVSLATLGASNLLKSLNNDNLDFIQLAAVLERFPSVAIRIISLANSAWSKPIKPITTLDAACSRLGTNTVKSVSIALAVSAPFNTALCPSFRPDYFWTNTMLVAEAAVLLTPFINDSASKAMLPKPLDASTAKMAALLHNLGLLFLIHNYHEISEQVLVRHNGGGAQSLNSGFFDVLGIKATDAGKVLGVELALPTVLSAAMSEYDNVSYDQEDWQVVAVVSLAIRLVGVVNKKYEFDPDEIRFGDVMNESTLSELVNNLTKAQKSISEITKSIKW